MIIEFTEKIFYWRGPAPWFFVRVPVEESAELKKIASLITYGWGVLPVQAQIGKTKWNTSLFPKDGLYLVPIKASVRKAEKLAEGEAVTIQLYVHD